MSGQKASHFLFDCDKWNKLKPVSYLAFGCFHIFSVSFGDFAVQILFKAFQYILFVTSLVESEDEWLVPLPWRHLGRTLFISADMVQSMELLHEQSYSHILSTCRIRTLILCFMLFVDLGHVHIYYWYEKVHTR